LMVNQREVRLWLGGESEGGQALAWWRIK
jgi:hypothetical protein